ncbi:SPFH/Band 7/PHB domain protein [Candidatus Gracilibacteria bacterium]|nr:SPFH/Band 7/PHB domain protein [Candidatus Gracilibacteria bacterium]
MDGGIIFWLIVLIVALVVIFNSFIKKINQGEVGLIEFLGKYTHTTGPGITFLIPGIQSLKRVDIREQVIMVPEQQIITRDNVGVAVDGIIYIEIQDPASAQYKVANVFSAVINLAQTNLRSVFGTMTLDDTLSNRDVINGQLLASLDKETVKWGVKVTRVEIKKLDPPRDIQDSMSKQMKAEREKRAQILEAEGYKQALITKSEGDKQSKVLEAEGQKQAKILEAEGIAQAKIAIATAEAKKVELESNAAESFFKGQAVVKEQLKVIENSFGENSKYIVDSGILSNILRLFSPKN